VVLTVADSLTSAERQLVAAGHEELVLPTRDLVLRGMRADATGDRRGIDAARGRRPSHHQRARPGADRLPAGLMTRTAITNQVVALLRTQTGKGPTTAKTVLRPDMVVITLGNVLTTAREQQLIRAGNEDLVVRIRDSIHQGMRADAITVVEELTRRTVIAYFADQSCDLDIAVLVFHVAAEPAPGH
jgi:uncharacterized protein YbcI